MSLRKLSFAVAGLSLFAATPVFAQDMIDGWSLNREADSCAIVNFDSANTMTMFNAGKGGDNEGMGFVRPGMRGVKDGESQALTVSIGNGEGVEVTGTGAILSDGQAGYIIQGFPISAFIDKGIKGTINIRRGSDVIHSFSLDTLPRPVAALMKCAKSL